MIRLLSNRFISHSKLIQRSTVGSHFKTIVRPSYGQTFRRNYSDDPNRVPSYIPNINNKENEKSKKPLKKWPLILLFGTLLAIGLPEVGRLYSIRKEEPFGILQVEPRNLTKELDRILQEAANAEAGILNAQENGNADDYDNIGEPDYAVAFELYNQALLEAQAQHIHPLCDTFVHICLKLAECQVNLGNFDYAGKIYKKLITSYYLAINEGTNASILSGSNKQNYLELSTGDFSITGDQSTGKLNRLLRNELIKRGLIIASIFSETTTEILSSNIPNTSFSMSSETCQLIGQFLILVSEISSGYKEEWISKLENQESAANFQISDNELGATDELLNPKKLALIQQNFKKNNNDDNNSNNNNIEQLRKGRFPDILGIGAVDWYNPDSFLGRVLDNHDYGTLINYYRVRDSQESFDPNLEPAEFIIYSNGTPVPSWLPFRNEMVNAFNNFVDLSMTVGDYETAISVNKAVNSWMLFSGYPVVDLVENVYRMAFLYYSRASAKRSQEEFKNKKKPSKEVVDSVKEDFETSKRILENLIEYTNKLPTAALTHSHSIEAHSGIPTPEPGDYTFHSIDLPLAQAYIGLGTLLLMQANYDKAEEYIREGKIRALACGSEEVSESADMALAMVNKARQQNESQKTLSLRDKITSPFKSRK